MSTVRKAKSKMKKICLLILFCFMATLPVFEQETQADSRTMYANEVRIMQEKLEKARQELKREIKIEVKVENEWNYYW